ncbi:hypothetical protein, partial [Paenibacillus sp. P46E]|uniref:hypothetical protein n=1 Tax=Paenibacillus sp. P46E TaxID=1349436 RepID=UPI001C49F29F
RRNVMIELIIGLSIAAILMLVEYLLSVKLENPLWGGILPLILIIGTAYVFMNGILQPNFKTLFPFLLLISFILGDWGTGREKHIKNRKAELEKMKIKDIEY